MLKVARLEHRGPTEVEGQLGLDGSRLLDSWSVGSHRCPVGREEAYDERVRLIGGSVRYAYYKTDGESHNMRWHRHGVADVDRPSVDEQFALYSLCMIAEHRIEFH